MTQKELLYFEDAIGHEKNIILICDESINKIDDGELISFFEKEKDIHEKVLNKLIDFLRGKVNE